MNFQVVSEGRAKIGGLPRLSMMSNEGTPSSTEKPIRRVALNCPRRRNGPFRIK